MVEGARNLGPSMPGIFAVDANSTREMCTKGAAIKTSQGEATEVRVTPGLKIIRVQIDSGAIDTVGPKEIAQAS